MRLFAIALFAFGVSQAHEPASGIGFHTSRAQQAMHVAANASTTSSQIATVCQNLVAAAQTNGLPVDFLTRLIWQESRFRSDAISPAGAQGVAQFMPATANGVGLLNPFDVPNAITKSAELLRHLKEQFGNLGLAAAAYNAGPKRVEQWLANGRSLPGETQAYVRIVTGRTVETWNASGQTASVTSAAAENSCPQIVSLLLAKAYAVPPLEKASTTTEPPAPISSWGVQLLGDASQPVVLAAYRQLQKRYGIILGNRAPVILRSPVGRSGYWYRVRVSATSRPEAEKLCSSLRALGGDCLVQRN